MFEVKTFANKSIASENKISEDNLSKTQYKRNRFYLVLYTDISVMSTIIMYLLNTSIATVYYDVDDDDNDNNNNNNS